MTPPLEALAASDSEAAPPPGDRTDLICPPDTIYDSAATKKALTEALGNAADARGMRAETVLLLRAALDRGRETIAAALDRNGASSLPSPLFMTIRHDPGRPVEAGGGWRGRGRGYSMRSAAGRRL